MGTEIGWEDAKLDVTHGPTRLLRAAEYWKSEALKARAALAARESLQAPPAFSKSAREQAAFMRRLAVAWLYQVNKPGQFTEFASVGEDDASWWPVDKCKSVTRTPLVECGPAIELVRDYKWVDPVNPWQPTPPPPLQVPLTDEENNLGRWLSAALEDDAVCNEMKTDIRAWFSFLKARNG